jgi:hypothetical protein
MFFWFADFLSFFLPRVIYFQFLPAKEAMILRDCIGGPAAPPAAGTNVAGSRFEDRKHWYPRPARPPALQVIPGSDVKEAMILRECIGGPAASLLRPRRIQINNRLPLMI